MPEITLDKKLKLQIKEHFESWSGGFPPSDPYEVSTYMDCAVPDFALGLEDEIESWLCEQEGDWMDPDVL